MGRANLLSSSQESKGRSFGAVKFFPGKAAEAAAMKACIAALVAWLVLGLVLEDLVLSGVLGFGFFFPCLGLVLYWPKAEKRRRAGLVEAGLPFCLMGIAVDINLGAPFLEALEHASRGGEACACELKHVLREVREQGAIVQDALRHFSERSGSRMVKRAVIQLVAAFEQGKGKDAGEAVKRIAAEALARQRLESKVFSGKLVVFSLLFIAVSAIVPALFQSFSIVGSVILQVDFTPMQLFLIITVGFPLLDLAVLLYIRAKTPMFLRCEGQ